MRVFIKVCLWDSNDHYSWHLVIMTSTTRWWPSSTRWPVVCTQLAPDHWHFEEEQERGEASRKCSWVGNFDSPYTKQLGSYDQKTWHHCLPAGRPSQPWPSACSTQLSRAFNRYAAYSTNPGGPHPPDRPTGALLGYTGIPLLQTVMKNTVSAQWNI